MWLEMIENSIPNASDQDLDCEPDFEMAQYFLGMCQNSRQNGKLPKMYTPK